MTNKGYSCFKWCTLCFVGIQFNHETPRPKDTTDGFHDIYEEAFTEMSYLLSKWLDPNAGLHEAYPLPIKHVDGKKWVHIIRLALSV